MAAVCGTMEEIRLSSQPKKSVPIPISPAVTKTLMNFIIDDLSALTILGHDGQRIESKKVADVGDPTLCQKHHQYDEIWTSLYSRTRVRTKQTLGF